MFSLVFASRTRVKNTGRLVSNDAKEKNKHSKSLTLYPLFFMMLGQIVRLCAAIFETLSRPKIFL